jgi:hypothetical protein
MAQINKCNVANASTLLELHSQRKSKSEFAPVLWRSAEASGLLLGDPCLPPHHRLKTQSTMSRSSALHMKSIASSGAGFLELFYKDALAIEFKRSRHPHFMRKRLVRLNTRASL